MRINAIKQQILTNYQQLSQLAHVKSHDKSIISTWGLKYKHNGNSGFINQLGMIERKHSSVKIVNGNVIQLIKKPFFTTWERSLKNINTMLKDIIENINNNKIVSKNVLNIRCFSPE